MSDSYSALTVVFEKDMRKEDVEVLIVAISQFKGVLSVQPQASDLNTLIATQRVRNELGNKILNLVYPDISRSE
ncbi:hypothetical protein [Thiolinea disciformis]|uniref:hypothetical protein n=1 Tax=Thiolinea disciformis TaxID=125614 RepID=UPI00037E42A0|nr:hypothetical protein [Thiolinea disciformis]